ncbi:lipoyl synthase [Candidatus Actinomarina sp.]|nr:lipoyl synthase [Candidatus Actinomarina sp.]MDA8709958.1 lipoyl synthase [Candidatus Actinomarina sp.]MDB2532559.1 lipoyl synthase [Candidatus Actinomarina sp.]
MRKLNVRWLGNLPYSEALILQKGLKESVAGENNPYDYLLLLEHNNVITIGRTGDTKNLLLDSDELEKKGIEFFETDRGGDITFHGKGQLIGYPIMRLQDPKKVIPFVRSLEQTIIKTLSSFGIEAFSKEDDTGVWTPEGKIASIGVKVSKWTTYHGFALNIFDKLEGFDFINPCGNQEEKVASVHTFNTDISFDDVVNKITETFVAEFGYKDVGIQMSQFTPTQLKKHKKHEIDEMLDKGVFQKNNNLVPITIKGLLPNEPERPEWMKVKANLGKDYRDLKNLISEKKLNTVCEEASCPNIYECWSMGTATFMIMGDTCTRACGFCDVNTGKPNNLDELEPLRVAESVLTMELTHAVITSVNRDDLPDGGSNFFAQTINEVKRLNPSTSVEVLIPDFKGDKGAIDNIIEASPEVLNHNLETVPRLQREIRTAASYGRSLSLLQYAKESAFLGKTKTGLIVGMGEEFEEVIAVLEDLSQINVDIVTIGQYLRPTAKHRPIHRYVDKEEFIKYKSIGESFGIPHIESGPLVRSSYHAKDSFASV